MRERVSEAELRELRARDEGENVTRYSFASLRVREVRAIIDDLTDALGEIAALEAVVELARVVVERVMDTRAVHGTRRGNAVDAEMPLEDAMANADAVFALATALDALSTGKEPA